VEFPGHNIRLGIGGGIDAINNISHGIRNAPAEHLKDQEGLAGSNPALCQK